MFLEIYIDYLGGIWQRRRRRRRCGVGEGKEEEERMVVGRKRGEGEERRGMQLSGLICQCA